MFLHRQNDAVGDDGEKNYTLKRRGGGEGLGDLRGFWGILGGFGGILGDFRGF